MRECDVTFDHLSICRFIYETEKHNGVAELLEILGRSVVQTCHVPAFFVKELQIC